MRKREKHEAASLQIREWSKMTKGERKIVEDWLKRSLADLKAQPKLYNDVEMNLEL